MGYNSHEFFNSKPQKSILMREQICTIEYELVSGIARRCIF